MKKSVISLLVVPGLLVASQAAVATTTATSSFQTKLTINASCAINSASNLDFGQSGLLTSATNGSSALSVSCSKTTPFTVSLDGGSTAGGNTTTRLMTNGSETVAYKIYSDSARSTNWGDTAGTDTVAGTGTGSSQTLNIYGQVEAQGTPAPGNYADTVTLTLTY